MQIKTDSTTLHPMSSPESPKASTYCLPFFKRRKTTKVAQVPAPESTMTPPLTPQPSVTGVGNSTNVVLLIGTPTSNDSQCPITRGP